MSAIKLLRTALYIALVVAVLHSLAMFFLLYGYIWWLDNVLHFSSGLCLGFASLGMYFLYNKNAPSPSLSAMLLIALSGSLVIGVAWEFFEYFNGLTNNTIGSYPLDTVKDLTFDVIGGYVAYLLSIKKVKSQI